MILQSYLDSELKLAKQVYLYYTDKIISYTTIGSNKYIKWYIDSLELYVLVKFLENIVSDSSGICYIGAEIVSENSVKLVFEKVREYYKTDINTNYIFLDSPTPSPTTPVPYIVPFIPDWKEFKVTITEDAVTTVTLPVSISIMDKESIQMTVNGISDPDYNDDDTLSGYHIIENTLYWHNSNFYNLMTNTIIRIQYLQIVG